LHAFLGNNPLRLAVTQIFKRMKTGVAVAGCLNIYCLFLCLNNVISHKMACKCYEMGLEKKEKKKVGKGGTLNADV
jgi:hypothetical protein